VIIGSSEIPVIGDNSDYGKFCRKMDDFFFYFFRECNFFSKLDDNLYNLIFIYV